MRVTCLRRNPAAYTCRAYLARGAWNAINDVNTLIDVGSDAYILDEISEISTGVGKRRVEQLILTHEHFDHAGGLKKIKEVYNPKVIAYSKIPGVDVRARDGMPVKLGDSECVIMHTPGHSHDSICIYCPREKALFSGDTLLSVKTPGGTYISEYVDVLEKLVRLDIETIYSGHDDPITTGANGLIRNTLENVLKSRILGRP